MSIIKKTIRNIIVLIIISVFLAILAISYTYYSKAKEAKAFYTETYIKAFDQTKTTSELIETILNSKNNITSQEISSYLTDIQNSLDIVTKDFELISPRFSSDKPNTNINFMRDLFQLYGSEIARLQSELSNNSSPESFDDIKGILFTRLNLMNSDLKKIIIIEPQLVDYSYSQATQAWIKLVNTLGYREVTKIYKLKYPHLFTKGSVLPFQR